MIMRFLRLFICLLITHSVVGNDDNSWVRSLLIFNYTDNVIRGMDPIRIAFLTALAQLSVPMVVSKKLWLDFVQTRSNFIKLKNLESEKVAQWFEESMYKQIQNFVQKKYDSLIKLEKDEDDHLESLQNVGKIIADQLQNNESLRTSLNIQAEKMGGDFSHNAAVEGAFWAYTVPFDSSKWSVFSYEDSFFLFIPKPYDIANLGFKVQNVKKVDLEDIFYGTYVIGEGKNVSLVDALTNVMITYDDISFDNYPYEWNIMVGGHGDLKISQKNLGEIDRLTRDFHWRVGMIKEQFGEVSLEKAALECARLIKSYKNMIRVVQNSKEQNIKKYIKMAANAGQAQKRIIELEELSENIDETRKIREEITVIIKKQNLLIAGLSVEDFRHVLSFLKNSIKTELYMYESCFSGSYNLVAPYISWVTFQEQDRYPFFIIATQISDLVVSVRFKGVRFFPPRWNINTLNIVFSREQGQEKSNFFPLGQEQHFGFLLKKLQKKKVDMQFLADMFAIEGVLAIRYPNGDRFFPPPLNAKTKKIIYTITKTILNTKTVKGIIKIPPVPRVVLETYFIPVSLELPPTMPQFLFPIVTITTRYQGGFSAIYIKEMILSEELSYAEQFVFSDESLFSLLGLDEQFIAGERMFPAGEGGVPRIILIDSIKAYTGEIMATNVILSKRIDLMGFFKTDYIGGLIMTDLNQEVIKRDCIFSRKEIIENMIYNQAAITLYKNAYTEIKKDIQESARRDNLEPFSAIQKKGTSREQK